MKGVVVTAAAILALTLGTTALAQTSGTGSTEKSGTSDGTSGYTSGSTSGSMSGTNNTKDMACERRTPSNQMSSSGPSGEKHGAAKPAENECGPAGPRALMLAFAA
jgi:hypothetical protein